MIYTKPGRYDSGTWVIPAVASWILYNIFDIDIEDLQDNIDDTVINLIQKKFYTDAEETAYIYIITDDTGYYKIGTATDVYTRLQQLQEGNPRCLEIIFTKKLTQCSKRFDFIKRKYENFLEEHGWYYLKQDELTDIAIELLN
jgi:hypothetical protein